MLTRSEFLGWKDRAEIASSPSILISILVWNKKIDRTTKEDEVVIVSSKRETKKIRKKKRLR